MAIEKFIIDENAEMNGEALQKFLNLQEARGVRYERLRNMYLGDHDIKKIEEKAMGKPNNKLVVNFARYIVDTLNGYFIGKPVKTIHENVEVADKMKRIAKRNNQNDNNAELSKMMSIYGHAYEFLYMDEEARVRITRLDPFNTFVIYNNDITGGSVVYGARVSYDAEGKRSGTLYSKSEAFEFYENSKGIVTIEKGAPHYFGEVPIIEYIENEERQAAFENVETLINAYNKAISEKANDVDYFADAYLAILGVELDKETIEQIRDNRVINLKDHDTSNIVVEFLDKPNADTTQENLINRLQDLIFHIAMVANVSDEKFNIASGVSLEYKLQPMENLALMKERKFTAGMAQRFKMLFAIPGIFNVDHEEYLDIDYIFSRNIPNDLEKEANAVNSLEGIVSRRTQLSALSIVDNVQDELERLEEEEPERISLAFDGG